MYLVLADAANRTDATLVAEAWAYVGLRVVHSLIQCFYNRVEMRFAVFAASSLVLTHMALSTLAKELAK